MYSTSTPKRPTRSGRAVCFKEARPSSTAKCGRIPVAPGWLQRYDCEYKRNGTANLFVFLDAHHSRRKVKVTERRTADDFAYCMRDLVDSHCPRAECIRVMLDSLSPHTPAALYQASLRGAQAADLPVWRMC
ncbi:hypothetical protein ABIA24_004506 [Sinorhizobium fredii]